MLAGEVLAQASVHPVRCSREERDAPPGDSLRLHGLGPEDALDHGQARFHLVDRGSQPLDPHLGGNRLFAAGEDDKVGEQDAIGAEIARHGLRILACSGDEDPRAGGHRRQGRPASFEEDQVGVERRGQPCGGLQIGEEGGAGEAAAAAPRPDGGDTGHSGVLEVVRGRVHARARKREQVLQRRIRLGDNRLPRTSASHRHDDYLAVAGEDARDVAGDRRLADPLTRSNDGEGRELERFERDRVQPEVGAEIRETGCERAARELEAPGWIEDGLVGEVDNCFRPRCFDSLLEGLVQRDAVILVAAQLFRSAYEHRAENLVRDGDERNANDIRVVLPVDQRQCPHLLLTSSSIRVVYFSNSSVSAEN